MLILRPNQNVRECPKEAVTASHTTHVWTCDRDSGSTWSYWCLCTAQLLTCTLLPLYIYIVEIEYIAAGVSVPVITFLIICGTDLDLFCTWEHSFIYTSELPLSSRDIVVYHREEGQVLHVGFVGRSGLRQFTSPRELTLIGGDQYGSRGGPR